MSQATNADARRSGGLRLGVFLFVAFFVGRAIILNGVGGFLADRNPALALSLGADSPAVLAGAAEQARKARRYVQAARYAYAALDRSPLYVPAIRERALALGALGKTADEQRLMAFAGQRSWRDNQTEAWLLNDDIRHGRLEPTIVRLDAVSRMIESVRPKTLLLLSAIAAAPRAPDLIARQLAARPEWRGPFLQTLAGSTQKDEVVAQVFTDVARSPAPLQADELAPYTTRLARQGRYVEAWQALRQLGRPAWSASTPFNGDFGPQTGVAPFDWQKLETAGVDLADLPKPSGGPGTALRVEYDGYSSTHLLAQAMGLTPGVYRLTGEVYAEADDASRLSWGVRCAQSGAVLGKAGAPAGATSAGGWRAFSIDFTVPAKACDGVWLTLDGAPGDRRTTIIAWFTGLRVSPKGGG